MASRGRRLINRLSLIVAVIGVSLASAQTPRTPTVTRTVQQFGKLERDLAKAKDATSRAAFLRDDFEERLCAEPGTPVSRQDWLASPVPAVADFSQEAVHLFGDLANYSALFRHDQTEDTIVDTWTRQEGGWKLAVRYRCPRSGSKPAISVIQKRY